MYQDNKRLFGSIFFVLSSFIYFFLAYKGFKNQHLDLNDFDKVTGIIIDKGIDLRYGSKGRTYKCFYIYLDNLRNQKLGVYRSTTDYKDLDSLFRYQDTVTVYFIDRPNSRDNINIDLIQAERNGQILIDKKEYSQKERTLIYVGLFAGILSISLSVLYFKGKIYNNKNYR